MLKQKHKITFELQKLVHCISTPNGFALRNVRFDDKFDPHIWKYHKGKAVVGIIYVFFSIIKKHIFFI